MRKPLSAEALSLRAVQLRAQDDAIASASFAGLPSQPMDPEVARYLERHREGVKVSDVAGLSLVDTAERVLMAEATVLAGTSKARHAHLRFQLDAVPLAPASSVTVAPLSLARRVRLEREAGTRAVMVEVVTGAERKERAVAIAMTESLRAAAEALGASSPNELCAAVGWVSAPMRPLAEAILALSEDAYRELAGTRAKVALGRSGPFTRADLGGLSRCTHADAAMPLSDRLGIASRWCARIGLSVPEPKGVPGADAMAPPMRLLLGDPEARPRLIGAPSPDVQGVSDMLAVVGELLAVRAVRGPVAEALGATRLHGAVLGTLARRLLLSGPFLVREAEVDRGRVQEVLRDVLFVELERMRALAVATLALSDALERRAGLGEIIAESEARALGASSPPDVAPHRVCEAWHQQAPRWLQSQVHASALEAELLGAHDEDWFRNPRAGLSVSAAADTLRVFGSSASHSLPNHSLPNQQGPEPSGEHPPQLDLEPLRAQLTTWFRAAGA